MLRPRQTLASHTSETLRLSGSVRSPYFRRNPDSVKHLALSYMKAAIVGFSNLQNGDDVLCNVQVNFFNESTNQLVELYESGSVVLTVNTWADVRARIETIVMDRASAQSYGISASDIIWVVGNKVDVVTGAHIADAATNAPTNLNVITTLLGTLTGEVNATNTKQNDLATKFNTLLDRLEASGLLASS